MPSEELTITVCCDPGHYQNDDRNEGMLKVAIEYLESDEVVFYAVGLAHLLDGDTGLVDALREAGYTVELVAYQ